MLAKKIRCIFKCSYYAVVDMIEHDGIEHAGYLSFVILLSVFPFLVFFMALMSNLAQLLHYYDISVSDKLIILITDNIPSEVISGLMPRIQEIISGPPHSLLTLAVIGTIWTASSAVEGIRTILNKACRVSSPPSYIFRRLLSIFQFISITLAMTIAMICIIVLPVIYEMLNKNLGYFKYAVSELVLFVSITLLYFIIPNVKQNLANVVPGAVLVTFLWTCSSLIFTWYLKTFHQLNIIYGSLASIIASLLFFYILSIFFIYGAEFNYRIKNAFNSTV
ncbi:YihY family protein [Ehrlichia ruminantium]|uniref:YihY/virulence factor BrkB family protein n=1 Tax=Ehrlichia ruminantium TaxID=779 RepID=UPI00004A0BD3|nr:YihY/virulence factor BrkB family protein [Ehrlichia ruminantium]KYW96499.1 ribonuclease [Ehrlichia ruminantium]QLK50574.1 YihY/virulence factor BrkB family protein [Ehrlichia ruminantium]QLK51499.1 YihY/virulence factor BrkB family protein [Ehrlichia ruminantium]QLK52423.1 YihY/virulence factor BrkB family protein [Ehrlichia ruminantium]QLK53334.1 YihY/virulence factor BrkB family protein [Ehrlichia ruminantium]